MHTTIFKTVLRHFQEVYEQVVCTEMFQMFQSAFLSDLTVVHQVYAGWRGFKVADPVRPHRYCAGNAVVLVYNREITQACRVKHLEPFSANGLFVHLLEVRQKSFKNHSVHSFRRSLY